MNDTISLIAGIASGLLGGGVAWGMLVSRVKNLEERMLEKASKEAVDGLKESIERFRQDVDSRFDKLEWLIRDAEVTDPGFKKRG